MKKGFAVTLILLVGILIGVGGVLVYVTIFKQKTLTGTIIPIKNTQKLSSPAPTLNETANWRSYENDLLGYMVKYPNNVLLKEAENKGSTLVIFNNYKELGIQQDIDSRPGNELENKSIYIEIKTEVATENTSLQKYLEQKYPDKGGINYGIPSYKNQKDKMKNIAIGGEKGLLKETGMMFENISRNAWVKKGNKVYTFTAYGSGETGTYVSDIAIATFDIMLSTFKFLE